MKIEVHREVLTSTSSIGRMYIDEEPVCYTLEDKTRGEGEKKVYGETAIPMGTYKITLRTEGTIYESYKKRFADIGNERGTLWIRDIPGYEYVLIHVGNLPSDTLGCILVGSYPESGKITGSEVAYRNIYPRIAGALENGENVTISINVGAKRI